MDTRDKEGSEAPHGSSLPTRVIYTAVVSVVAANIIAGLTLLIRNPMDEIDDLHDRLEEHIYQADLRMDQIERDHVGFDILLNLPTTKHLRSYESHKENEPYPDQHPNKWTNDR